MSGSQRPGLPLPRRFFTRDPVDCARDLVGCWLLWGGCGGRIVETEAYAADGDEACHTFVRPSARQFVESHAAGTAYVYLNYGVHWLSNVLVKGPSPEARGFVLLRALEPLRDLDGMRRRRGQDRVTELCSGPGKLSRALGIDGSQHGEAFCGRTRPRDSGLFAPGETALRYEIACDRRVGISKARELTWRFLARDNPHVSVKPGRA